MKQYQIWLWMGLIATFFLTIIVFREDIMEYLSKNRMSQVSTVESKTIESSIEANYNYTKNGESFQYTFLEFGSTGCAPCRKMESVMDEIKTLFPQKVNVVFINVTDKKNEKLSQFYGIATIPTQVLLDKSGKELYRHSGFISAQDLSVNFK